MNILLVLHSLECGGAERVSAVLARQWTLLGHQVSVLTFESKSKDFYQLPANVSRYSIDSARSSSGFFDGLWANIIRIFNLRARFVRHKPDLVISMTSKVNIVCLLAAVGYKGLRVVVSERTYPPMLPLGRSWEFLRKLTYGLADAVVVPTQKAREWASKNTRARLIEVIPNPSIWPLPVESTSFSPEDFLPPGRKRIIGVGRLCSEKSFDKLIAVFANLAATNGDWDLVIVGDGPLRKPLSAQAVALGVADRVFFPGCISNVGEWLESASVFALCSSFEGFPNALLEAMTAGLAVVSFDCDTGPADLIDNGVNGLLVPAGDVKSFEKALLTLLRDAGLRACLAESAVGVRQRLAIAEIANRWIGLARG